ncbi:MAG: FAD-binding oxidoreductase [Pseudomonadota bacterium]
MKNKQVVIVGAGLMGVATALWLARAGIRATVLDAQGVGAGASQGNGGVLANISVVPLTTPGLPRKAPGMLLDPKSPLFMKWRYLPRLLPWLRRYLSHANAGDVERISHALQHLLHDAPEQHAQLAQGTDAEQYLKPGAYHYAYRDRQAFEAEAFTWGVRQRRGFDWTELTDAEFAHAEPAFGGTVGHAIRLDGHGRITDPHAYLKALARHAEQLGVAFVQDRVLDFQFSSAASTRLVRAIVGQHATYPCTDVVLATGAWSKSLAAKLGITLHLETERGYHVEFHDPSLMPSTPVMVAAGKFVITPMEGRIRSAGVVEFAGLSPPASEPPFDLLIDQTKAALPGLTYSRIDRWMGHRPAPADSIPYLGASTALPNAHLAVGHHHIGLTASAKTGRILADCVVGTARNDDLSIYSPDRSISARSMQGT